MRSTLHMGAAMMAITGLGIIADAGMFLTNNHVLVSGLEAALGLVIVALAGYGIRRGYLWAWVTTVGAFILVLAVVAPIRYGDGLPISSHLGMMYSMGALMFMVGAFMTLGSLRARRGPKGSRHVQNCCVGPGRNDQHEAAVDSASRALR